MSQGRCSTGIQRLSLQVAEGSSVRSIPAAVLIPGMKAGIGSAHS